MTNPPQILTYLPPDERINHAEWARAFRAWERRRACPDDLVRMDRKEAADAARQGRVNKGRKRAT